MQKNRLLMIFVFSSFLLILLCLLTEAKPIHLKRLETIRLSKIQKVSMKDYPRKRDYHVRERNVVRANFKIDELLRRQPIIFGMNGLSLDENESVEIKENNNKVILARVIDVLNHVNEDVVMSIAVHTNQRGSNRKNLKYSQILADKLKKYVTKRSNILLVTSIGYGEEFPLINVDKNVSNERIEIGLKRVQQ
jgi:outer membrane protein OmpA-like peptidoglycan-associated protein